MKKLLLFGVLALSINVFAQSTEVTYTTKQYYDEKIKKPIPVPLKPKPKTSRDFLDEI